jgi:hypothetical protein
MSQSAVPVAFTTVTLGVVSVQHHFTPPFSSPVLSLGHQRSCGGMFFAILQEKIRNRESHENVFEGLLIYLVNGNDFGFGVLGKKIEETHQQKTNHH